MKRNIIILILVAVFATPVIGFNMYQYFTNYGFRVTYRSDDETHTTTDDPYPYLKGKRNIEFNYAIDGNQKVKIQWYLWFDGEIAGSGEVYPIEPNNVNREEDKLRETANKQIKVLSEMHN